MRGSNYARLTVTFIFVSFPALCAVDNGTLGDPVALEESAEPFKFCGESDVAFCNVRLSLNGENQTIARALPRSEAAFRCPFVSNETVSTDVLQWFLFNTTTLIGEYNFATKTATVVSSVGHLYSIIDFGALKIKDATRIVVNKYICAFQKEISLNGRSIESKNIVLFRLNYHSWYSPVLFDSVYYGAVMTSVMVCGATFFINILWIGVQKIGLYWLRQQEQENIMSAMETYRQRQIQNLQDAYHRNVNAIREQYHVQVEQVRDAYSAQISKLKNYQQSKRDNVAAHIDSIRENYLQQLSRIREYGARHAEILSESYERQLNRVRAFSLQQRLKMMRQYKVKQHHLDVLIPDVRLDTSQTTDICAVLDLKEPQLPRNVHIFRSVSSLSLPEFTLVDGGNVPTLRQISGRRYDTPLLASTSSTTRFRNTKSSESDNRRSTQKKEANELDPLITNRTSGSSPSSSSAVDH